MRRVSSAPGEDLLGLLLADDAAVDQLVRREHDAPEGGFVLDDLDVAVEREDLRQAVVQRDEIAEAVHRFELVLLHQLVGDGDAVDPLPAFGQIVHAQEDAPVLLEREVVGVQKPGDLDEVAVVEQDRAEHEFLGVNVCGEPSFEGDVGCCHVEDVLL